jgi:CheY-like chemotaxis protein
VLEHKITVASILGRGSSFAVDVPIAPALPSSRQPRIVRDADRVQLSGIVVLCIDNDLAILDGMETLLRGWGCRVLKATDLASAVAAIVDAKVSLDGLLVDYHLDQGNGIEAIVELRRRFGPELTAILITADRSPRVREEARTHGVQVLNKPVRPAALRALLTQWRVQRVAAAE